MRKDGSTGPAPGSGWRSVVVITWSAVFACVLAVAVSSRTIGRPVWWLGPSTDPAPYVWLAVPIVLVFAPLAAAFRAPRHCVRVSLASSVGLLLTAVPDLADKSAVATAVGTVGFAALLASVGVMLGQRQYR